jgi:hypothetical protein
MLHLQRGMTYDGALQLFRAALMAHLDFRERALLGGVALSGH